MKAISVKQTKIKTTVLFVYLLIGVLLVLSNGLHAQNVHSHGQGQYKHEGYQQPYHAGQYHQAPPANYHRHDHMHTITVKRYKQVWVEGFWKWNPRVRDYVWMPGRWVARPYYVQEPVCYNNCR